MVDRGYPYVGKWVGPMGLEKCATVVLIAADWIITAKHVAENKIAHPDDVDVTVWFTGPDGKISAKVVEAVGYPKTNIWWEIALAKLDRPIEGIPPVALASNEVPSNQEIEITIIGKDSPVPGAYCKVKEDKRHLIRNQQRGNKTTGVVGNSGGAWIVEHQGIGPDVVVGIIQGRGDKNCAEASQPVVFRKWIDEKLAEFGAEAKWVAVDYR